MRTGILSIIAAVALLLAGCAESGSSGDEPVAGDDTGTTGQNTTADAANETAGANTPPTAGLTPDVTNGSAPLTVNFTIDGSDADGDNLTWELSLNGTTLANGTSLPGAANTTFEEAGNYTLLLTVSDGMDTATANTTITVEAGVPAGPCGGEPEPCVIHESAWVTVWSDGRCDAAGTVLPLEDGPGYIHDRNTGTPGTGLYDGGGTWAFEESNGIAGLQLTQDGSMALDEKDPLAVEWNCQNGDALIF